MPISNYPNGFSNGLVVKGVPVEIPHPGKVFWVNNSTVLPDLGLAGSDGNEGSYLKPFSTIDYAIGKCKANRGDVIYAMPGHSETVSAASGVDFDVAGVRLIGLGHGSKQARFNYTAAAATVAVGADDVVVENMNFRANNDSTALGLVIEDGTDYTVVRNCTFDVTTSGTDEFDASIQLVNNNTGCIIEECTIDMGIANAVAGILMDADTAKTTIRNNVIRGDFSTANIVGDTTLSTNVDIKGNLLENGIGGNLNAQPGIELLTGTTGTIRDNYIVCNVAAAVNSIVADTCLKFQNKYNETIATTGINLETADA